MQVGALFQRLGEVLCTFTLDLVALQVQAQQPRTLGDQVAKSLRSFVGDLVESKIDVLNVDGELIQCCAESNEVLVGYTVFEVKLIVSLDDDFKGLVVLHCLLEVLHQAGVGVDTNLLTLLLVDELDFLLAKFSVFFGHIKI